MASGCLIGPTCGTVVANDWPMFKKKPPANRKRTRAARFPNRGCFDEAAALRRVHKKHIPRPAADTGSVLVVNLGAISEFVSVLVDSSGLLVIKVHCFNIE